MSKLFTPNIDFDHLSSLGCEVSGIVMNDTRRARLSLSDYDHGKFRCLPGGNDHNTVIVTDETSGHRMEVARAECDASCFCAATVLEVLADSVTP